MQVDRLWTNARLATLDPARPGLGIVEDGAIAAREGRIAWVGARADMPALEAAERIDLGGRWVTPGLIDCHTHLVYGGNRAHEFELRLAGASYEEIARAGGGILSTVKATRAATEDELVASALPRLDALIAEGVTTIEIKSGYGLELETEARQLRAARRLGELRPVSVAHHLPRRARAAARGRRRQGPVHRPPVQPDAARDRRAKAWPMRSTPSGGHRLQRRADGARVRGGQARWACR